MDSFIHVAGWPQHHSSHQSSTKPLSGHFRSLSSIASSSTTPSSPTTKPRVPLKSPSTSHLPKISLSPSYLDDEMSTLPDPRSRRVSDANDDGSANGGSPIHHHPDLNDEVAALSTKLINAINHQTALDDTLSATRQELDTAHNRICELENRNVDQQKQMATDKLEAQSKLNDETALRTETEQEKKKIEQELENLATALFEEANRMVIGAKEEAQQQQEVLQRKNDQLKSQLEDSEALLKSQQEQLAELKQVMESIVSERDDQTNVTAPSSPGNVKFDTHDVERLKYLESTATSPINETMAPAPPTSLQHLIQPVLRHDLAAFEDFIGLARHSDRRAGSRISSGSIGGLAALTLGLGGSNGTRPSNMSSASLGGAQATSSAPHSPNTPTSSANTTPNTQAGPILNLKETKFYKRVLVEDIEPTLRLDAAPGLSWLARRSVLTAVTEGTLVVEPIPMSSPGQTQFLSCTLCGDSRKEFPYLRNHRFRTSEVESAQRYPLCNYCVARIRSTCGFLGFLRMIKDGHWRADDEDHEKTAWEESVRLREQMFWARIGGGVVPTSQIESTGSEAFRSARTSQERPSDEKGAIVLEESLLKTNDALNRSRTASLEVPRTPPEQITAEASA